MHLLISFAFLLRYDDRSDPGCKFSGTCVSSAQFAQEDAYGASLEKAMPRAFYIQMFVCGLQFLERNASESSLQANSDVMRCLQGRSCLR